MNSLSLSKNMPPRVVVLGAGCVGAYIARILAQSNVQVTAVDVSSEALHRLQKVSPYIRVVEEDLSDPRNIHSLVQNADVVVGAVPGFLGYRVLEALIQAKKPVVDISFMPEDPMTLHDLAHKNGSRVVVDMGLSPGLNNLFVGYACSKQNFDEGTMVVGGLPKVPSLPYQYQVVFSVRDVIEEYTRPARFLENGKIITKEALSDVELINFDDIGTLEAFNTDGLRTLLKTSKIPTLKEKTLRYPGHAQDMWKLRFAGFFEERFLPMTCEVLKQAWAPKDLGHDLVVLDVRLKGKTHQAYFSLRDEYHTEQQASAMARTTGLPCVVMALALLESPQDIPVGVYPPEFIGHIEPLFHTVLQKLKAHGVHVRYDITQEHVSCT